MKNWTAPLMLAFLALALPAWAGVGVWTPLGPDGGEVDALLVDPADPRVVYTGTVNSGVFRSVDGGETWSPSSAGIGAGGRLVWVSSLAADPRRPGTIYAGTAEHGVFKRTDRGRLWVAASAGLPTHGGGYVSIPDIAVDPFAAGRLYAATAAGVFASTDGGATWKPRRRGLPAQAVNALVADPRSGRLWAGLHSGEIFTSEDRGASWTVSVRGLQPVLALAVHPDRPAVVLAGTAHGLYRTANRGRTWSRVAAGTFSDRVSALAFQPSQGRFHAAASEGTAFSADGGLTWRQAESDPVRFAGHALAAGPRAVYAGTRFGGGVFRSLDGGLTWAFRSRGLSTLYVSDLEVDPGDPERLYATVQGLRIVRSTDRGASWSRIDRGVPSGSSAHDLVIDPARSSPPSPPSTIFAACNGACTLLRSDDGGDTWEVNRAHHGLDPLTFDRLALDPRAPEALWAGNGSGLYHTEDGGATWVRQSLPADGSSYGAAWILDVEPDPADPRIVYAAGAVGFFVPRGPTLFEPRVFRSLDGGQTWERRAVGPRLGRVDDLATDPAHPGTVYAATTGGLYRSTDFGDTWELALAQAVHAVAVSPAAVYAATLLGEVLRSADGGETWASIRRGLGWRAVTRLVVDPHDPRRLYAGTNTGGIYTYTEPAL